MQCIFCVGQKVNEFRVEKAIPCQILNKLTEILIPKVCYKNSPAYRLIAIEITFFGNKNQCNQSATEFFSIQIIEDLLTSDNV